MQEASNTDTDYRRVWAVLDILIMRNDHIDIESLSRGLMDDYRT